MGGFFPAMFGDLLKMMRSDAPVQWDFALQLAQSVAADVDAGNAGEANVEPVERIRLEGLVQIAELHVADVTGMVTRLGGGRIALHGTTRTEWARRALEGWRWLLDDVAAASRPPQGSLQLPPELFGDEPEQAHQLAGMIGQWAQAMAPAMTAMQIGSAVGHLARHTLGQYEVPVPRHAHEELDVVPANIAEFVEAWSLPADDTALYLLTRDVATHAVLTRPHVAERLGHLLVEHARGLRPDPRALSEHLREVMTGEVTDIEQIGRLLGDPTALAPRVASGEGLSVSLELEGLSAVLAGYVEWVTDTVAARAIAGRVAVREALRRRRLERGAEERAAEALFGLELDHDQRQRGAAFITGVLERGGESELAKLWVVEPNLPTPAEVDAPGLWIERVNLPHADPR